MADHGFDTNVWTEALREAFAPAYKAQQDGLKTLEHFAKFQYAIAGDYLQHGLAQAQAALASRNAAEFLSKQADLGALFGQRISARAHELSSLASETPWSYFSDLSGESPSSAASSGPETPRAKNAQGRRQRERRTR
jgi:Phasin protein